MKTWNNKWLGMVKYNAIYRILGIFYQYRIYWLSTPSISLSLDMPLEDVDRLVDDLLWSGCLDLYDGKYKITAIGIKICDEYQ